MKTVMNFTVVGSSKEEIYDVARKRYNEFVGSADLELPHSTVIEVTPLSDLLSGDVNSWQGVVHISEIRS